MHPPSEFLSAASLDAAWQISLLAAALFLAACQWFPARLAAYQPFPWSFQLSRAADIRLHCVAWASEDRGILSRIGRTTLLAEHLAWAILAAAWSPAALLVGYLCVLIQALALDEGMLTIAIAAVSAAVAGLATGLAATAAPFAVLLAKKTLLGAAAFRGVAHWIQTATRTNRRPRWVEAAVAAPVAYAAAFASGLPFRWYPVAIYRGALTLGLHPMTIPTWDDVVAAEAAIRRGGLDAWPHTAALAPARPPQRRAAVNG